MVALLAGCRPEREVMNINVLIDVHEVNSSWRQRLSIGASFAGIFRSTPHNESANLRKTAFL